jgi:DNA-binding NarL/FixJ family response regulator
VTRLLIVDDHPMLRAGVRAALEGTAVDVVADADTVTGAVREATLHSPDVVLMDLGLPDGSGIDATRMILEARPGTAVLAFTMAEDDESVFAALRAGALGYLVKGAPRDELIRAIEVVAGGEALFLGPGIARRVQAHFAAAATVIRSTGADRAAAGPTRSGRTGEASTDTVGFATLSARERDVLDLMAAGWGNQAIAERLFLAPKTVRNQVSIILGKLHASDRGEAVVRARQQGYGELR